MLGRQLYILDSAGGRRLNPGNLFRLGITVSQGTLTEHRDPE